MNLRDQIDEYMKRTGETQAQIADKAGVSRSCICRILGGQEDLRAKNYQAILQVISSPCNSSTTPTPAPTAALPDTEV